VTAEPTNTTLYRIVHGLISACLILLALIGLHDAVFVVHLPHLVWTRTALLAFYLIIFTQATLREERFLRTWKQGVILALLAITVFVRFQIFPYTYVQERSRQLSGIRETVRQFRETNSIGNGSEIGEWYGGNCPIWYATMGDAELPPLLLSLGLPFSLMLANIMLRSKVHGPHQSLS